MVGGVNGGLDVNLGQLLGPPRLPRITHPVVEWFAALFGAPAPPPLRGTTVGPVR